MRNIALFLKCNGTAYRLAVQKKRRVTVGETLEGRGCGRRAQGTRHGLRAHRCGRACTLLCGKFPHRGDHRQTASRFALNSRLPEDVVVTSAGRSTASTPSARACGKRNTPLIYNSRIRDRFMSTARAFYPKHLDENIMREQRSFVSEHDFAAVRSVGTEVKSPSRTVYYYDVQRDGNIISLKVCANGFLYNMARAMAGTVVYAAEESSRRGRNWRAFLRAVTARRRARRCRGGLYMTKLWARRWGGLLPMSDNVTHIPGARRRSCAISC